MVLFAASRTPSGPGFSRPTGETFAGARKAHAKPPIDIDDQIGSGSGCKTKVFPDPNW
jgi:hypothetical protein